jgi:hypothetical protein
MAWNRIPTFFENKFIHDDREPVILWDNVDGNYRVGSVADSNGIFIGRMAVMIGWQIWASNMSWPFSRTAQSSNHPTNYYKKKDDGENGIGDFVWILVALALPFLFIDAFRHFVPKCSIRFGCILLPMLIHH